MEGSSTYRQISTRMSLFEHRAMNQFAVLNNWLTKEEDLAFAIGVLSEFQSLLVGVQMAGVRLLFERNSSFASHFEKWDDKLADHLEEMARNREPGGRDGAESQSA